MATDWIKMRTDLYRDPKVIVMADLLCEHNGPLSRYVNQHNQCDMSVTQNVTRCAVVGGLVAVWGVARHRGKRVGDDLLIEGATLDVLDSVSELPGFGEVMSVVGWAVDYTQGVVFPRFFAQHNVDPEDQKREQAAARKRRQRERDASVTGSVTVTHREEKSREEKSEEEEENTGAKVCVPQTDLPPDEKPKSDDEQTKHKPRFVPPTLTEVEAYCRERSNRVDSQRFHDFYTAKNWMVGKNKMKDWRAAVRTWEKGDGRGKNGRQLRLSGTEVDDDRQRELDEAFGGTQAAS